MAHDAARFMFLLTSDGRTEAACATDTRLDPVLSLLCLAVPGG